MTVDKHTLALISIIGSSLDVLGALYLAYDLLGGEHGPLRTLSRAVTYGVFFGVGFGVALGPVFGVATGITHGITLAWELSRASRSGPKPGFWYDAAMSAIRGAGFGLGSAYLYGAVFGAVFGSLSALAQTVAYQLGIRPTIDYQPVPRPRFTKFYLLTGLNRTVGYTIAGSLSAFGAQQAHALDVGIKTGLIIGVVTATFSGLTSWVEWSADRVPQKGMGVFGVGLILTGFALQSVQYWLALFDINIGS